MRAIGASEKIASVSRGQDQLTERGTKRLEIARDQRVDQIEAGHRRRRAIEHVEPAERRRRPAEQEIEDIDQHQSGEEHRQRHAGRRGDAAEMVDPRAGPGRGENAERDRDHDRNHKPEQRQFGGRRQAVADFGRDRLAGGERIAEIAMREIVGIAEELFDQRLVEAEFLADLLDRLLGRGGTREIGRGIAGQRARQQERDDHHPDQRRDREHQPLADHGQHEDALVNCNSGVARLPPALRRRAGDRRKSHAPDWRPPFSLTLPRKGGGNREQGSALREQHTRMCRDRPSRINPSPARDNRAGGGTSIDSPRCSSASRR